MDYQYIFVPAEGGPVTQFHY